MTVHQHLKGHLLTPALTEIQWTRAECLLQWHTENGHENIIFSDEKIFTIKEQYNHKNDKIFVQTFRGVKENILRVQTGHHPAYITVRWGVLHQGATPLSFLRERGETGAKVYQEDMLQGVVKQLNMIIFSGQEWVFQQDSAPAHKAKTT